MVASSDVRSHGLISRAPRRWWRRAAYAPLTILVLASITALVLGIVTTSKENARPIPAAPSEPADAVSAACRPPVDAPADEPWLAGDGKAEAIWQSKSQELSLPYLIGPNGWIFWSDYIEQYASQAVGRKTLTTAEIEQWVSYYGSVRDGLAAEGIDFYIVVTPSTSSVYPEELPEWMQPLRGSTILDQFMAGSADLPVVDLRASLAAAKTPDVHLFSWSNSHWTDYGGYVGWKSIAGCVNELFPDDTDLQVPEISGFEVVGDFNEWAPHGVASQGADWAEPTFADPLQDVTYTDRDSITRTVPGDSVMDSSWLPIETSVAAPWTGKSAVIVRDSMGGALSPYWDQAYSPTWQVSHSYVDYSEWPRYRELAAQHNPDVVVLQLAERHLVNPPPAGAKY